MGVLWGKVLFRFPFQISITESYNCLFVGAFGNVRVGWTKSNKSIKYAIKTMKKAEIINSKHVDHIENEKNILEIITHPFVVIIS